MATFGSNVITMGGHPPQNGQNPVDIKGTQFQNKEERMSEGKTSRVIGYSYSVPFVLAAGWHFYTAILYYNKVSGPKTYDALKAGLAASKITLPSIADTFFAYVVKELWFSGSFNTYYGVHGGVAVVLLVQGLFMFNVSFCRINQHSYTALAFGHLGLRSMIRTIIESSKGITALVLAGISAPLFSLFMVTSPQLLSQGVLVPAVAVGSKVVAGFDIGSYIGYVYALVLLAPVPAAVVLVYALITVLLKMCAYPYPDRPSSESVWKFGAIFAILITLVVVIIGGTLFAVATSSALTTYLGLLISAESSNQSSYKPKDQIGILWMSSRGILGMLFTYPLTGQVTQWIANAAFPAKGDKSLPSRAELIQEAELKIVQKERIKELREKKINDAIQTAVLTKKQNMVARSEFIKRISNEAKTFNHQQSKGKNTVVPIQTPTQLPQLPPIKTQPALIVPPPSKPETTQSQPLQVLNQLPQTYQPETSVAPQYTEMQSDSRFAVPYQATSKSNLLGGTQPYSQRYPVQPAQPIQKPAPVNRLPSRFPLLPSNVPQTLTETQNVGNNGETNLTEENLLSQQPTEYGDQLATDPEESMRNVYPLEAQEDYDLSPIPEVSPGQEDVPTNPVSPTARPPPFQSRRDSQVTMPSLRLPKPVTKLPKYVPGKPSKMTPPTIPVQVGRGPLRIPEGYKFNNPRLEGR